MSEPITPEQLKSHPIMGTWSIAGTADKYPGFLHLADGDLTLKLDLSGGPPFNQQTDPRFIPFAPPNQPTLHGETKAGRVTLFNCAQSSHQSSNRLDSPEARVELILRPVQAWCGGGFVDAREHYKGLRFRAPGLHNILTTIHIDRQFLVKSKPGQRSPTHQLKKITGANQAFLVYQHPPPVAEIVRNQKRYAVMIASSVSHDASSTEGISINTSDFVIIQSEGAFLAELMTVAAEVEHFLCLLCIGPVRGERITLDLGGGKSAERLWQLGKPAERTTFTIMPHEILVLLGAAPGLAKQAIEKWFEANDAMRLARWLIVDALFTEDYSTAKFLSVAQAWEIAGREESNVAPYNKTKFKEMRKVIEKIIKEKLGDDAAKRMLQLISSSNRESFLDFVKNVTGKLPQPALNLICGDVSEFVRTIGNVRNVLTHMEGKKKMSIEKADRLSLFLTYKLLVLFCIHVCVVMDLPLGNLPMMLRSNRMARVASRPLPV